MNFISNMKIDECMSPIFITGAARSGTTLLFNALTESPSVWSLKREEHAIFEWGAGLQVDLQADTGNMLDASDATIENIDLIRKYYWSRVKNPKFFRGEFSGRFADYCSIAFRRILRRGCTLVDKNPKHVYRIPFLESVFPNARFIFIKRSPLNNIYSLYEGWVSGRFKTYGIQEFDEITRSNLHWSFELPPGWRAWRGRGVLAICCYQYAAANAVLDRVSSEMDSNRWISLYYEDLVRDPRGTLSRIFGKFEIAQSAFLEGGAVSLPVVNAITEPSDDKWLKIEFELREIINKYRDELGFNVQF